MIHGLLNCFSFTFLVHVDIWLTTYVPHVDKRGHFIDHILYTYLNLFLDDPLKSIAY